MALSKDGTGTYYFNCGPDIKQISVLLGANAQLDQHLTVVDLAGNQTILDATHVYGQPAPPVGIGYNPNNIARQYAATGQWRTNAQNVWIKSDFHIFGTSQNSITVGWDDQTNLIGGGNPDGDYDDLTTTVTFTRQNGLHFVNPKISRSDKLPWSSDDAEKPAAIGTNSDYTLLS